MVSLRMVILNVLRMQRTAKCSISIGKYTPHTAYIVYAESTNRVAIGKYCSIGHGVIIVAQHGHTPDFEYRGYRVANFPMSFVRSRVLIVRKFHWKKSYYLPDKRDFVLIRNDVILGANAIVLPGVTIGDGAIIGAGAVVTHDIPPYAIVAGVPAKVLRYRYSEDQIKKLLKIAWWNWDEEKIVRNMDYFYGKVEDFIQRFYTEAVGETGSPDA